MPRQRVPAFLWLLLFILQVMVATALTLGIAWQSPTSQDQSSLEKFAPTAAYTKIFTDRSQLSIEEQRRLLGLCRDLEDMLQTHVRLGAAVLGEARQLMIYMLVFVAATLVLQILIALTSARLIGR